MKLSLKTNPVEPGDLLIRMHNQVGAAVDVTGEKYGQSCRWLCHGCGERSEMPESDYLFFIRRSANTHAGDCRAAYHRIR